MAKPKFKNGQERCTFPFREHHASVEDISDDFITELLLGGPVSLVVSLDPMNNPSSGYVFHIARKGGEFQLKTISNHLAFSACNVGDVTRFVMHWMGIEFAPDVFDVIDGARNQIAKR